MVARLLLAALLGALLLSTPVGCKKGASTPAAATKKLPPGHEGHRHEPSDEYRCPMHPKETAKDANGTCPICKMKMTKMKPEATKAK